MIYFVDEDVNETEPYTYAMQCLGYETTVLENADDAFECLVKAQDIEAIILDVMLATKGGETSRFDASTTNNFVTTGLKLLDDLVQQRGRDGTNKIPNKIILFSTALKPDIVNLINTATDFHGIIFLNKLHYDEVSRFAEKVLTVVRGN
jgi:CheY-like chemotaxis protein